MQNEIELKIMLHRENIPFVQTWLETLTHIEQQTTELGNTYFDTPDLFFAQQKMGLRVRSENGRHELTLKMKGEIVGGLHIRPEYNLALPDATLDFKRLVSTYNLQIDQAEKLEQALIPTFSTDFLRQTWLVQFGNAEIEIALDQGTVKNQFGEEQICELEFELKQGNMADLFAFLDAMPKTDGMWLSSLSKAQRGYLVGRPEKIAKEIEKMTACQAEHLSAQDQYQLEQQVADFFRLTPENRSLIKQAERCFHQPPHTLFNFLHSAHYLEYNLAQLRAFYQ